MGTEELTLQQLSERFDTMVTNFSTLKEQNDALQQQNTELAELNKQLHAQNAELSVLAQRTVSGEAVEIESAPPKLPDNPVFTIGKQKYRLLAPSCHIPGIGYRTADEILMDKQSQQALVDMNAGIITAL